MSDNPTYVYIALEPVKRDSIVKSTPQPHDRTLLSTTGVCVSGYAMMYVEGQRAGLMGIFCNTPRRPKYHATPHCDIITNVDHWKTED